MYKFIPIERLKDEVILAITGKTPDPDGLQASKEEVEKEINTRISELSSINEIVSEGLLYPDKNDLFVDGWSGFRGSLEKEIVEQ